MSVFAAATAHRSSRCRKAIRFASTEASGGMLARGLVYCSLPGEISGYKRFRSVESVDYCEPFEPEPDADRIARRFETVRILRAAFDQWRKELQSKAKTK